jgi:asparagine synthase (glutamine-hydrolysing)
LSAFVVALKFDGSPIESDLIRRLAQHVAYRGPDASGEVCFPDCMFVHHLMRATRSCAEEAQPLVSSDRQCVVVCDARFDQRRELTLELRRHGRDSGEKTSASRLLLDAYEVWGEGLPERISGDFSFVIVDRKRHLMLAARDPFGLRTLYYATFPNGLILSNDPLPAMAHPEVDLKLDRVALGDFLLTGRVTAIDCTLTPFVGIRQLAGGHRLLVDLCSGRQNLQKFWQFPMESQPLYYRNLAEYGEHFRSVFKAAVKDRIDAPAVVAPMSGGMDSTTAVAMAAELIADGYGPDQFTAITAVQGPEDPEGLLAAEVCRSLGLAHRKIDVCPGKPLESWRSSPFPQTNFFSNHERNQQLSAEIARVSINASSADYVLCPEPFTVFGQLRVAGARDTWRALRVVGHRYGYRPPLGTGLISRMRGRRPENPYTRPAYAYPQWLQKGCERELALRERWEQYWSAWPNPPHPLRPTAHRMITAKDRLSMHSYGWPLDFAPPIPVDPFLDKRVIQFLWSLPPLPWFYNKHLTRAAMAERLPAAVVRRKKTPARQWLPIGDECRVDFSWQPGPLLSEFVNAELVPDLNSGLAGAKDFHPMFLQKWLNCISVDLYQVVGRKIQVTV